MDRKFVIVNEKIAGISFTISKCNRENENLKKTSNVILQSTMMLCERLKEENKILWIIPRVDAILLPYLP
jgi:hypothetical protein